jgi:Helix-turn-helix domain
MPPETPKPGRYPLLETVLAHKGLQLKGTYTVRDVAALFGVCVRAIQARIQRGELASRNLPGRAKFLSLDLEEFLQNSSRRGTTAS